jgi:predicted transcriptional regulator
MIERQYSLRRAAKLIGVSRPTVKKWLAEDLGLQFPRVERGSKLLVSGKQIEFLIRRRAARKAA